MLPCHILRYEVRYRGIKAETARTGAVIKTAPSTFMTSFCTNRTSRIKLAPSASGISSEMHKFPKQRFPGGRAVVGAASLRLSQLFWSPHHAVVLFLKNAFAFLEPRSLVRCTLELNTWEWSFNKAEPLNFQDSLCVTTLLSQRETIMTSERESKTSGRNERARCAACFTDT